MQRAGQPMPLPDWYTVAALAERWHITPPVVMNEPIYWVARTRVLMAAEAYVSSERNNAGR